MMVCVAVELTFCAKN